MNRTANNLCSSYHSRCARLSTFPLTLSIKRWATNVYQNNAAPFAAYKQPIFSRQTGLSDNNSSISTNGASLFWLLGAVQRSEILLQEKEKLFVGIFAFSDPLICPAHLSHYIALIVNGDDFKELARNCQDLLEFLGSGSTARTI